MIGRCFFFYALSFVPIGVLKLDRLLRKHCLHCLSKWFTIGVSSINGFRSSTPYFADRFTNRIVFAG